MAEQNQASESAIPNTHEVADHQYSRSDYDGSTQLEQGTAETHEQVSDVYMTGNNPDDQNQALSDL